MPHNILYRPFPWISQFFSPVFLPLQYSRIARTLPHTIRLFPRLWHYPLSISRRPSPSLFLCFVFLLHVNASNFPLVVCIIPYMPLGRVTTVFYYPSSLLLSVCFRICLLLQFIECHSYFPEMSISNDNVNQTGLQDLHLDHNDDVPNCVSLISHLIICFH